MFFSSSSLLWAEKFGWGSLNRPIFVVRMSEKFGLFTYTWTHEFRITVKLSVKHPDLQRGREKERRERQIGDELLWAVKNRDLGRRLNPAATAAKHIHLFLILHS